MDLSDPRERQQVMNGGPVGSWRTMPGTPTGLVEEFIRFDPDGTGEAWARGVLSGEDRVGFRWKVVGEGLLAVQTIDPDDPVASEDWSTLRLLVEPRASDTGRYWVLREDNSGGFWRLAFPVVPVT